MLTYIKNIKIRNKLMALLAIPTVALLLTAMVTIVVMNILTANKSEIYSSSSLVLNADRDMYQALTATQNLFTYDGQSKEFAASMESFNENVEQVNDRVLKVNELIQKIPKLEIYLHSESKVSLEETIQQFEKTFAEWTVLSQSLIEAKSGNDTQIALQKTNESFNAARDYLNLAGEIIDEFSASQISEDNDLKQSSIFYTILSVSLVVILIVVIGIFFIKSITSPIYILQGLMGRAEKGDLTVQGNYDSKDEIGQLNSSFNAMLTGFKETVAKVLTAAEGVSASAQEISASTEEIASSGNDQAKSAQTMNELFGELAETINSVARSAGNAADLSNRMMDIAKEGGNVVNKSISGMDRLNEQVSKLENDSNKIGEIIEVIDDIAEQTNLLALNAAIEAARAGDQGRGFAVVADEVRKLAERSGEATKQITTIIKGMQQNTLQSVKAVEEGVASSQQTGEAFERILSMVNQSGLMVSEIAEASEQQAAQTTEVLHSIETISSATEEAASSSEETAAAAQSLAQLAEDMNTTVSVFKIL
ncbi:methyl-accepting chemotaxis protein [Cohnella suwonensis]|uniref:Methyl-accepting chemotaxis protein n=1 Tax=Cohnella suwonensis TaxID=696072 RepID=A0ABW0M0X7_9BACL